MADKDLLLVVSEILLKQDRTNDTLEKFMGVTEKFMELTEANFKEQRKFNEVCIKQFEAQYKQLENINQRLGNIEPAFRKYRKTAAKSC